MHKRRAFVHCFESLLAPSTSAAVAETLNMDALKALNPDNVDHRAIVAELAKDTVCLKSCFCMNV